VLTDFKNYINKKHLMNKICITGANGFIGRRLQYTLFNLNRPVVGTVRSKKKISSLSDENFIDISTIDKNTDWSEALTDCKYVVHCAGLAHVKDSSVKKNIEDYRSINVEGTKKLAKQAASMGVKRLVFLSSIGVNGLFTNNYNFFLYSDIPYPTENYSISKYEAEQALFEISKNTGMEIVIIRSPLVYGQSAPGNLKRLIKLISLGIPLPFEGIKNKRSLIGVDNLVNLIIQCIDHSEASGKIFLASDGKDLSTPELIRLIASSMGRKANLLSVPLSVLKFLGLIFGKREEINRLTGSLRVDSSYTKETLNWTPPISVEEGFKRMVQRK